MEEVHIPEMVEGTPEYSTRVGIVSQWILLQSLGKTTSSLNGQCTHANASQALEGGSAYPWNGRRHASRFHRRIISQLTQWVAVLDE
jgi:hypothetical protein